MTIEQIRENMEVNFQRLGLTEQQAKRAAEGRNGPLFRRIASCAPSASTRRPGDLSTFSGAPSPRIPSRHEISEELAKRTADLLIETHGHRLSESYGQTKKPAELPSLKEIRESMAANFQRLGMNEESAKQAAQGRNQ